MVEKINFGSVFNKAVEGTCLYNDRLDTYGQGCQHDCKYCYAKSLLQFRGLRHPSNPKPANLKEVYKAIATECSKTVPTRV